MQRYLVYCGVLILGSPCVLAGTATATLNVTATVISACSVSVPTNVAFGNYNPASGSPTNATGTLNVTCTSSTPYQIAMDAGANASTANNTTTRRMQAAGSRYLPYSLYLDSGHTTIWGDGNNSSSLYPTNSTYANGTGVAQSYSIYGQITANQYVAPGSYSDTVTVTVTYS